MLFYSHNSRLNSQRKKVRVTGSKLQLMRKLETLTIVTPCYNEQSTIRDCVLRVRDVMESRCPDVSYEHLVVDNASLDQTVEILEKLAATDRRLKVIVNSRNVGASRSMLNALKFSQSQACVPFLAADLQDPPDLIPEMISHWEDGFDRIYGIRENRQEGFLLRNARTLYYRLLSRFSSTDIPQNVGEFQLLDAKVINQISQVDDHSPFVRGLIAMTGARSIGIKYDMQTRKAGTSKAPFLHLIDLGLDGLLSTSKVPARIIFVFGALVSFVSVAYTCIVLLISLVLGSGAGPGINTLVVGLFFFSGIQLISIAVVGEYVIAIHSQVRRGPLMYIERKINL